MIHQSVPSIIFMGNIIQSRWHVTLCGWSAKQTIPLSALARNQTKGLDSKSRRDRKWVREREKGVGKRNSKKELTTDDGQGSRHRTAERPVGWDEVQSSEGRWVQMSLHSSWVVEFSLEIQASFSLYMLTGMQSVT